jgi:hypothetical protein
MRTDMRNNHRYSSMTITSSAFDPPVLPSVTPLSNRARFVALVSLDLT